MMQPYEHPDCNLTLTPPADWNTETDGECVPLPVQRMEVNGRPGFRSWWKPSAVELQRLVAGEAVMLEILAVQHPPVAIEVTGVSEGPVTLTQILDDLDAHGIKIGL